MLLLLHLLLLHLLLLHLLLLHLLLLHLLLLHLLLLHLLLLHLLLLHTITTTTTTNFTPTTSTSTSTTNNNNDNADNFKTDRQHFPTLVELLLHSIIPRLLSWIQRILEKSQLAHLIKSLLCLLSSSISYLRCSPSHTCRGVMNTPAPSTPRFPRVWGKQRKQTIESLPGGWRPMERQRHPRYYTQSHEEGRLEPILSLECRKAWHMDHLE